MFRENLERALQHVDKASACHLIGIDGIPVASVFAEEEAAGSLSPLVVELSNTIGLMQRSSGDEVADLREVSLVLDHVTVVARIVAEEYLLVLMLSPGADVGKGAQMLRLLSPWIEREM